MRYLFIVFACLLTLTFCAVGHSAAAPLRKSDRTISCKDTVSAMIQFKEQWWRVDHLPRIDMRPRASLSSNAFATTYSSRFWQYIVFQGWFDADPLLPDENWELYRTHPGDWSAPVRLTNTLADERRPRLNLDSTQIVFVSDQDGNDEIYRMNINGGSLQRLTNQPTLDTMPVWRPDGQRILFVSSRTGNAELYLMNPDGTKVSQLTFDGADDAFPAWSPDGKQIAWVRINQQARRLWVMNADGSNAHAITGALRFLQNPAWSPDGSALVFDYDTDDADVRNELALINVDGSNLHLVPIVNLWPNYTDVWVGGWFPDRKELITGLILFAKVTYDCNANLLTSYASLNAVGAVMPGQDEDFTVWPNPALPDIQTQDPWPPTSRINALPALARSSFLQLSWTGTDPGPSGIERYDLQAQTDTNTTWGDFNTSAVTQNKALFLDLPFRPIKSIAFRSRAIDSAGNIEAWPEAEKADTSTRLYDWLLQGKITDNRGHPLAERDAVAQVAPVLQTQTDTQGEYKVYKQGESTFNLAGVTVNRQGDAFHAEYQLPHDNLLREGGFETFSPGTIWTVSDPTVVATTDKVKHGQTKALRLGHPCADPCLETTAFQSLNLDEQHQFGRLNNFLVDHLGNVHMVGINPWGLPMYQARLNTGAWIPPIYLQDNSQAQTAIGALDTQNILHVVWATQSGELYYTQRQTTGQWTQNTLLGQGYNPVLTTDPQNNVHLLYTCVSGAACTIPSLYYRQRASNGEWSQPLLAYKSLGELYPVLRYAMVADSTGAAHVLLSQMVELNNSANGIFYTVRKPGAAFSPLSLLWLDYPALPVMAADAKDNLYLLEQHENVLFLFKKPANGDWPNTPDFATQRADGGTWDPGNLLVVDRDDQVHIVDGYHRTYRTVTPAGAWSEALTLPDPAPQPPFPARTLYKAALDAKQTLHLWQPGYYQTNAKASVTESAVLSQTVTIPAEMHQPTLAFFYQLQGATPALSFFHIEVTAPFSSANGVSATQVSTQIFTATMNTPWSFGSVNLDAWRGQTITIAFKTEQAANTNYVQVYLDEISLGSWETPIPESITPPQLAAGVKGTLLIQGQNFIATPTVKLGETPLANVQWQDEHTLTVEIPPTFQPGLYNLWISNPGQQLATSAWRIAIGEQRYLPLITK